MRAIITFHSIDDEPGPLSFPASGLRMLLEELAKSNIPVRPLDELLSDSAAGVSLTFDDGLKSVYTNALPILAEYNVVGHIFVVTGKVGGNSNWEGKKSWAPTFDVMKWEHLETAAGCGLRIEAHTHHHPDLRAMNAEQILEEMARADDEIAARIGRKPEFFAYPFGHYNDVAQKIAKQRYRAALTTELAMLPSQLELSSIPRIDSHYLRTRVLASRLGSPVGQAYIGLRHLIRRARALL